MEPIDYLYILFAALIGVVLVLIKAGAVIMFVVGLAIGMLNDDIT